MASIICHQNIPRRKDIQKNCFVAEMKLRQNTNLNGKVMFLLILGSQIFPPEEKQEDFLSILINFIYIHKGYTLPGDVTIRRLCRICDILCHF